MDSAVMPSQYILITGSTAGIGWEIARRLARQGHHLLLTGRNAESGQEALAQLQSESDGHHHLWLGDLSEMDQVRSLAREASVLFPRIDILVNNVGRAMESRQESADGREMTFALNVLGPWLLTRKLLPHIPRQTGRIVNLTSSLHWLARPQWANLEFEKGYTTLLAYANAKLLSLLFTYYLAGELNDRGITVHAADPGISPTPGFSKFYQNLPGKILEKILSLSPDYREPEAAALSPFLACVASEYGRKTGKYIGPAGRVSQSSPASLNSRDGRKINRICAEFSGESSQW